MTGVKLSKRLMTAAQAVRPDTRVADIGCDHGQLCAHLVQSGRCVFATAIDISDKSLQKATELFDKCDINSMTATVRSDGLDGISPADVDDVVIAGLGADSIIGIIERATWLKDKDKQLVLVPSSQHARLRMWLSENGYEILEETAVREGRHCYTVITARYSGKVWTPGPVYAAIGIMKPGSEDYNAYLDKAYTRAQRLMESVSGGEKLHGAREIVQHIERIRKTDG